MSSYLLIVLDQIIRFNNFIKSNTKLFLENVFMNE